MKREEKLWLSGVGSVTVGEGEVVAQLRVGDEGMKGVQTSGHCASGRALAVAGFDGATLLSDACSVCLIEKKRQTASSNAWLVQGESASRLLVWDVYVSSLTVFLLPSGRLHSIGAWRAVVGGLSSGEGDGRQ